MVDALEDEAGGANPQRVEQLLVRNLVGEYDNRRLGNGLPESLGGAKAAAAEAEVEEADVRALVERRRDCTLGVLHFRAHRQPRALEHEPDPVPEANATFRDQHPRRLARAP